MRRRRFVAAFAATPSLSALLAQQPAPGVGANPAPGIPVNPTQSVPPPSRPAVDFPKLDPSVPDAAAEPIPRYFSSPQFAALRKVSGILMPSVNRTPGALEAKAAEFLDFLIGRSPADRQEVYRAGLDALNAQSVQRFKKDFSELGNSEAETLLSSLRQPWTHDPPSDPVACFLRVAKQDVRTATVNSLEFSITASAGGNRRGGGTGQYWYPLD